MYVRTIEIMQRLSFRGIDFYSTGQFVLRNFILTSVQSSNKKIVSTSETKVLRGGAEKGSHIKLNT